MKILLLILMLAYSCVAIAEVTIHYDSFTQCPGVHFRADEIRHLKPNNVPCVYAVKKYYTYTHAPEWDDKKCFSCDDVEDFLILPVMKGDGTFLDEEICPNRELLPYEKCSLLRVSQLKVPE